MKYFLHLLVLPFFLFSLACRKDPPEAILPEEVSFGESIVYLNGAEVDYLPDIQFDTVNRIMTYGFVQSRNNGQLENLFGFGYLPYQTGAFELTYERLLFVKANAAFSQTVSEDLEGNKYKLMDADEGFLHIDALDTVKQEVKGRFKVKFCRTSKNGNRKSDLPKYLVFQGVFYENYIMK